MGLDYMQETLALAALGRYSCSPNPMVGCIIVHNHQIVGRGWHQQAGGNHAEIEALHEAGPLARGATVYVNLEPCSHYGRTGPCVDALIQAKVRDVHIAILDPNPLVNGQGIKKLEQAGIPVYVGKNSEEAFQLNQTFFHCITHQRPFVIAKWAMSLDGKIASTQGNSQWITSEAAREKVHQTRQEVGAIVIGANTAILDNPKLTTRLHTLDTALRHPLRIILTRNPRRLPFELALFSADLPGKTIIATNTEAALDDHWHQEMQRRGVEILFLTGNNSRLVSLPHLLAELWRRAISIVMVEGGAAVLTQFLEHNLINQIHSYIAPKVIGGKNAPTPCEGQGIDLMINALQFKWQRTIEIGQDFCLIANSNNIPSNYQEFLQQQKRGG